MSDDTLYPASPCTSICKMHPDTGLCRGCARTLDEIAAWSSMSAAQQHKVLLMIAQRQALPAIHQ